jgi:hypothetical protein
VAADAAEWSPARNVPGSVGAGFPYDVAVGPRGLTAVAFVRDGVRVAVREPGGPWRSSRLVSRGRTGVTAPDVEVAGSGEVIVAWTQSSRRQAPPLRGGNDIRVAIRSRRGAWGAPRSVGRTLSFVAAEVRLATNARGDAAVVWRGQSGRARDVVRAALRPGGRSFRPGVSLGEPGIDLQVGVGASGRVFASWTRTLPPEHLSSEIRFAVGDVQGRWTDPVSVQGGRVGGAKLRLVPDGSVVLAWRSQEQGLGATRSGLVTAAVRSRDGSWGPARTLSEIRTDEVHVAVSGASEVIVAWSPAPGTRTPPAVYSTTRAPGVEFGPVTGLDGVPSGPLAVFADGTAVTVGAGRGIETALRPPGGVFAPLRRVTAAGDFPTLAAFGRTAVAVWLVGDRLRSATLRG